MPARLAVLMFAGTALSLAGLSTATTASTSSPCAVVMPTPSGFLAVRSGPGLTHYAVFRVRPGLILGLDHQFDVGATGWRHVSTISVRRPDGRLERVRDIDGWVDGRFVKLIECQPTIAPARGK